MLEFLPECLLIEILLLLPLTSALQLKSVCKLWYNIIKSPHFISKHLDLSNDDNRHNNRVIAQLVITQAGELVPYIVRLDDESGKNITTLDKVKKLRGEAPYNINSCNIFGPCDGLYYVWCVWMEERRLWNPALKQFKMLPPVEILKPSLPSKIYYFEEYGGFGFDHVSVDYKVVIITAYWDSADHPSYPISALNYPPSVLIYSLRNDSWKYVRDLSRHYYCKNSSHTFVNTSLYWLGSYDKNAVKYHVIIAVNLATEAIEEVGLPETRLKGSITYDRYSECLMVYRSSIALVALYKTEGSFDIWTLKKSLWSKELRVTLDCRVRTPLGYYDLHKNMVLFGGTPYELILYFIDDKVSRVVRVGSNDGYSHCTFVSSYKESLVPLNNQEFWVQWEKLRVNRQIITH